MVFPRSFSHLGIVVSDISQAVDFYTQALGCYLSVEPLVVHEGDGSWLGEAVGRVVGTGWGRLTMAHLTTPDEIGVDLVEVEGARAPLVASGSYRLAFFHGYTGELDAGAMARRIVEHGGRYCARVRAAEPGERSYTLIRCEDPFGNVIEIVAGDPERALAYGAY